MDSQRSNDVSPEAMQARIQQARREAETLKDRIKRKKDELADTTRQSIPIEGPAGPASLSAVLTCPSLLQSELWPSKPTSPSPRTS